MLGKYEYRKIDDSYCIFYIDTDSEREVQVGVIFTEIHAKIITKMLNDYHNQYASKGKK